MSIPSYEVAGMGEFDSIQRLSATVKLLDGVDGRRAMVMIEEEYKARQEECKQLVVNGLLDIVKRSSEACSKLY
jgi:hypothetical protein